MIDDYLKKWCCLIFFTLNTEIGDDPITFSKQISCAKRFYIHPNHSEKYKNIVTEIQQLSGEINLITQMSDAFQSAFDKGFRKVICIHSCFNEVMSMNLIEAFNSLKMIEFCIGPKSNGETYLLGMNYYEPTLFEISQNSTLNYKSILKAIGNLKLATYKLKLLNG